MKLETFISHSGAASRRGAKKLILSGKVRVNGKVSLIPSMLVSENDEILLGPTRLKLENEKRYILLYKPAGYVCSAKDEKGRKCALELLEKTYSERLYSVGRLDMQSEGLLIFTNDGLFARKVAHPSSKIEKEYLVKCTSTVPPSLEKAFTRGIKIENVVYRAVLAKTGTDGFTMRIILNEGKNREIRRVFAHFSLKIRQLVRIRIGKIKIKGLSRGDFRTLTKDEIASLFLS